MRTSLASFLAAAAGVLVASAAQAQERPLEVGAPAAHAPAEQPTEMNSVPLFVTGTSLAAVGVASVITGAAFYGNDPCTGAANDATCGMGFGRFLGLTMMGGGGLLALAGAPLIVAGAWQVESEDVGVPPTTAELRVGAGRAELDVRF
jgi:hypothetical protein